MIRGAIFDIDGTLLDSMPIWEDCGSIYLRKIGKEPEEKLGEILFTMTLEEGSAYLKEHYGLSQTEDEITQGFLQVVADFYRKEAALKPGAKELVEGLHEKGIPMVLATTGNRELAQAALERVGIWHYFAGMFTATELHTGKHEPLIYLTAADSMGTRPEETAVLEDVLHAVQTAKKAGFYTVAVADAASMAQRQQIRESADVFVESLQELVIQL